MNENVYEKAIKEANTMSEISSHLKGLDSDSVDRILKWLNGVYAKENINNKSDQLSLFGSFPSFYSQKEPKTDKEKALTLSYWLQEFEGKNDIDALTVNQRLDELGAKIQNITRAFHSLQNSTPPLAEQTEKSSTKKLGRKFYRLTKAGKEYVEKM